LRVWHNPDDSNVRAQVSIHCLYASAAANSFGIISQYDRTSNQGQGRSEGQGQSPYLIKIESKIKVNVKFKAKVKVKVEIEVKVKMFRHDLPERVNEQCRR